MPPPRPSPPDAANHAVAPAMASDDGVAHKPPPSKLRASVVTESGGSSTNQPASAGEVISSESGSSSSGWDATERQSKKPSKKGGKPKKDRSKLRKGKWTVEEEEYTSRIIHYFSTGLLTLPDGATLRSYLADKLNCDPMRVTKKYAGAACLGRRAYHFRNRVHPSVAEIQLAKAELDHLEQRFRMKVEHGHTGPPLPSPTDIVQSLAQQAANPLAALSNSFQAHNALQTVLLGLAASQNANLLMAAAPQTVTAPQAAPVPSAAPWGAPVPTAQQAISAPPNSAPAFSSSPVPAPGAAAQWLLPNAIANAALGTQNTTNPLLQGVDPNLADWAFTQAAASLGPALSQLAVANIQQAQAQLQTQQKAQPPAPLQMQLTPQNLQLQAQISEQQKELQRQLLALQQQQQQQQQPSVQTLPAASVLQVPQAASNKDHTEKLVQGLRQTFDLHVKSHGAQSTSLSAKPPNGNDQTSKAGAQSASLPISQPAATTINIQAPARIPEATELPRKQRTEEDKAAGSALLGFLSSLRQSYEDALRDKNGTEVEGIANMSTLVEAASGKSESSDDTAPKGAMVTDSSSSQQQIESSVEDSDWNSDKKTDPSSSEDSDKEVNDRRSESRGPPRKRLKTKKADETNRVSN